MEAILAHIGDVSRIMADISTASQEQAAGIDQVNQAVAQMDQVTQQNAALVEESVATAQALREQADALARIVQRFTLREQAGCLVPAS